MWQRFTEKARKTIFYAQAEARLLNSNFVSTEHLLLGLIQGEDNVATVILARRSLNPQLILSAVKKQCVIGSDPVLSDSQLTPRAKRVIDLAYDEARQLDNNYIGTEHLLLGLIREEEGIAGRVLAHFDLDLLSVRNDVIDLQAGASAANIESLKEFTRSVPRSAEWVDRARAEAALFGADSVKAEHEFLAELHDKQSVLARALLQFGVDLDIARAAIQKVYDEADAPEADETP